MWTRLEKNLFVAGAILSGALVVCGLVMLGYAARWRAQCRRQAELYDVVEAICGKEQDARELYARLWHSPDAIALQEEYEGIVGELDALYSRAREVAGNDSDVRNEIAGLRVLHDKMRLIEAEALVTQDEAPEPILSDDYQEAQRRFRSTIRPLLVRERTRLGVALGQIHRVTVTGAVGAAIGGGLILLAMVSAARVGRRSIERRLLEILAALEQAASGNCAGAKRLAELSERSDLVGELARVGRALVVASDDAREQAIESEALCHHVLDTIPEIVCVMNHDGSIRYANCSLMTRTGWSAEEIQERSLGEISWFHPEDDLRMRERLREVFAGHGVPQTEYRVRCRDGHYIRLQEHLVPVRNPDGKVIAAVAVATDVTEQEKVRGDLGRSARLTVLGLLTRSVLAEFNSLLASIHAQAEAAIRTGSAATSTKPEAKTSFYIEALLSIWRTVSRAVVLSRNIQRRFGEQVARREACSVVAQVQTAVSFLLNELSSYSVGCREEYGEAPAVMGDPEQLCQAFVNLLESLLSSSVPGTDVIEVRTRPTDGEVEVLFRSAEGPGIPEEESQLASKADPFLQEVAEETAARVFGLWVTRQIIAAHGGVLEFAYGVGKPWHVRVLLPTISEKAPDARQRQEELSRLAPMRILVVDEVPIQRAMKVFLEEQGHTVVPCADLRAACRALETARYEAVFCDIAASRFGGPRALRNLLQQHPSVAVVVLTSDTSAETAEEAMRDGAFAWLRKPFGMEDVREMLERIQRQERGSEDGDTVDG